MQSVTALNVFLSSESLIRGPIILHMNCLNCSIITQFKCGLLGLPFFTIGDPLPDSTMPMPSALRATSPLRPPRIKYEGCHHRRRKRGSSCPWTSPGTRWRLRPKWRSSDGLVQGFQVFQRSAALGIEWDRCAD